MQLCNYKNNEKKEKERQNRSLIITFINATKEKKLERIQARIEG